MADSITVRTDEHTRRALAELTADGTLASDAVRNAVIETAARHARDRLRAEVTALANDPDDLREAAEVLRDMESLSAR